MKKLIVGSVLLASVISASVSFAGHGNGNYGGNHSNYSMNQGQYCGNMMDMQNGAMIKFHTENPALFKQMIEKKAELKALTIATTPNIERVGKVAGELFDIRTHIQDVATKAGVTLGFHQNMRGHNMDQATLAKINEFNAANKDLKKQLVVKRAERRALFNMDSPSPEKAKSLAGEIFDIRSTLIAKADKSGIPAQIACSGMGEYGYGQHNNGKHRGNMDKKSMGQGRHDGSRWN